LFQEQPLVTGRISEWASLGGRKTGSMYWMGKLCMRVQHASEQEARSLAPSAAKRNGGGGPRRPRAERRGGSVGRVAGDHFVLAGAVQADDLIGILAAAHLHAGRAGRHAG